MRFVHRLMVLYICAKSFQNVSNPSWVIEWKLNTVIQCLTLILNLEPTWVKHTHCTLTHHTWHLCTVTCQLYQRYRADMIVCLTLNYGLDLNVTLVKHTHCTSTHHTWHLCIVICKIHQSFKGNRAGMIVCLTLNYSEASFIRAAVIRKHRYPGGFSRERNNAT